jgi:hypothetical protein
MDMWMRAKPCIIKVTLLYLKLYFPLFYNHLVGLPSLARVCVPARTFINIRGLVVKIPNKITAIVSHSWLDVNFLIYIVVFNKYVVCL